MAVMVQVSRLLTPRSRSLRRVATRSPTPSRSPALVATAWVSSTCPAATSRSRIAPFNAAACSRVSAIISIPPRALVTGVEGVGGELGQRLGAFGVAGVDPDLATAPQRVPHLTDPLTNRLTNPAHHPLASWPGGV